MNECKERKNMMINYKNNRYLYCLLINDVYFDNCNVWSNMNLKTLNKIYYRKVIELIILVMKKKIMMKNLLCRYMMLGGGILFYFIFGVRLIIIIIMIIDSCNI
jgi:hypothetical protein